MERATCGLKGCHFAATAALLAHRRRSAPRHCGRTPSARRAAAVVAGARAGSSASRRSRGQLGVSRNTVLTAYDLLAADGLLAGRTGSGTVVTKAPEPRLDPRQLLRDAHDPARSVSFRDPDGNPLGLHL